MPTKTADGKYKVDIRPNGRDSKRFRKTFSTNTEAIAFERYIRGKYSTPDAWENDKPDRRRLSDLCTLWLELHGQHLKSGHRRMSELNKVVALLGDPIASEFTAQAFTDFRAKRIKSVSANTANHDLVNLRSLFNELERLGEWNKPNPVSNVRRIKIDENELSYLELDQIDTLLTALEKIDSHAHIQSKICLSTGARWGESKVKASQVKNGRITFTGTKNGKNRSVPIDKELEKLILNNVPIVDGMNTFKRTVAKLDLNLPKGQMTHVLRHTFASHFMINGGDIITLQRVLGHGNITMTMRYAHLSPEHLKEVIRLNPLGNRKLKVSTA